MATGIAEQRKNKAISCNYRTDGNTQDCCYECQFSNKNAHRYFCDNVDAMKPFQVSKNGKCKKFRTKMANVSRETLNVKKPVVPEESLLA